MIELFEQYGYNRSGFYDYLTDSQKERLASVTSKSIFMKGRDVCCVKLDFDEQKREHHFETNYFVGVDWLVENKQAIYVHPKMDGGEVEIDYLGMLQSALHEPQNLDHLDGLVQVDFEKPYIEITQKQDLLSPFLIAQFLQILRRIVQKGLKKSYYTKIENLRSRIKGKILVSRNIKSNLSRGNITDTYCSYQEFGIDSIENRILKKAYSFSSRMLQQQNSLHIKPLLELVNYVHPAFENVSEDIDIQKIKSFKPNPLFKEYDQAIKFALLILRKYSYNISKVEEKKIKTPPFWIDMSKLFELYVYRKLRDHFKGHREVIHHMKAYYQELDFVINSRLHNLKMVVDTKYKPHYHERNIEKDDARQVCGYARLESVYNELGMRDEHNINIDALIIYSHQDCDGNLHIEEFKAPESKINGYVNIYKVGIKLPSL